MRTYLSFFAFFFLSIALCSAQEVQLEVRQVEEKRSNQTTFETNNRVMLEVKVSGIEVNKSNKVKIESIDSATDNLGTPLEWMPSGMFDDEFSSSPVIKFSLTPGKRQATEITEIRGKLTVVTEDTGNDVTDIEAARNSDLLPDGPENVRVLLLDRVILDSISGNYDRASVRAALDRLRATGQAVPNLSRPVVGRKLAPNSTSLDLLMQIGYMFTDKEPEQTLHFIVYDPDEQIVALDVIDKNGHSVIAGDYSTNTYKMLPLRGEIQADWRIKLRIKSEDNMREVGFVLRNVKLP